MKYVDSDYLKQIFSENLFELTPEQVKSFEKYAELLIEYNNHTNLTAITDPKEIALKHFLDSAVLLKYCGIKQGANLIDVGTGAGFPALPLKILRPDLEITLLDSLNKRLKFLVDLREQLSLNEVDCVHSRAEDGGRNKNYREKYDIATARAVANLASLSEYCLPFVKVGGVFIALKGAIAEQEIEDATKAISILGGKIDKVFSFTLPEEQQRNIIVIKKISQTPPKYPRMGTKIQKDPIK